VSELLNGVGEDSDDFEDPSRRRALWALLVLGCLALIIASLMVLLGGNGSPKNTDANPAVLPDPNATSSSGGGTTAPASTSATASASSTAPTSPPASGNPCPAAPSCFVDGDGGAVAAVNAFRTKHGVPVVTGAVSAAAQTCALKNGTGPTCVPHYAWTSVPSQDGRLAVTKAAQFAGPWLLDAKMASFNVGWAYVGGQYNCVLLKSP
jgi:hypothetical protein